jgi:hypothetical protein
MRTHKGTGMRICECGSFWGPGWDHEQTCQRWPGSEWARDHGGRQGIGEGQLPKTRAAYRNRAGVHAREAWRRQNAVWWASWRSVNGVTKPRPVGVPEPSRGRLASGLGYRVDSEGTEYTRRRFIGGPYGRKLASNPNKRRKRRRG